MQALKSFWCVWLAAAVLAATVSPSLAQDSQMDQAKALLAKGIEQYDSLAFIEAKVTLLDVDRSKLPDDQSKRTLDTYLNRVNVAIQKQNAGFDAYRDGQQALRAGQLDLAMERFQVVLDNEFMPEPTLKEARASLAEVKAKQQIALQEMAVSAEETPAAEPVSAVVEEDADLLPPVVLPPGAIEETVPQADAPAVTYETRPLLQPEQVDEHEVAAPIIVEAAEPAAEEAPEATVTVGEPPVYVAAEPEPVIVVAEPRVVPAADPDAERRLAEQAERIRAKARARELAEQGDLAMEVSAWAKAASLYQEALDLDPELDQARRGLERAGAMVDRGTGAMSELIRKRELQLQLFRSNFDKAMLQARAFVTDASQQADFAKATDQVRYAQSLLMNNRSVIPAEEFSAKRTRTEELLDLIATSESEWQRRQVQAKLQQAEELAARREQIQTQQRSDKLQRLRETASLLERQSKWDQALETVEEMLRINPGDQWALAKQETLRQNQLIYSQRDAIDAQRYEESRQMVEIEWDRVPWYELMRYPKDWAELTSRRNEYGLGGRAESPANMRTRELLGQVQQQFDFQDIELENVFVYLQDVSQVNLVVNWNALEQAGILRDTPVTLRLSNVSVETALKEILAVVGSIVPLDYVIDEGVVRISTQDNLATNVFTKVYQIRDLIHPRHQTLEGTLSVEIATGEPSGAQSDTGGAGTADEDETSRQELIDGLVELIQEAIDPESWRDNGGTLGYLEEFNGALIVTQTPEAHRRIDELFVELREEQSLQVNIEARFITVNTGFLNDIGVGLDFFFNTGSTIAQTGSIDPITGAQVVTTGSPALPQWSNGGVWSRNTSAIGATQGMVRPGGEGFITPTGTSVPGSIGSTITTSAMTLAGTFLDDIQVDFLIRATQAHQRTTSMTNPRITVANGSSARVFFGREQAYVSELEVVVSDNTATYEPQVSTIRTGTSLIVTATVSADRRYVRMNVTPEVATVLGFQTFAVNQNLDEEGNITSASGFLQLPTSIVQSVSTTVTVPDGGTLLLGGQRLAGEVSREMGVPILNKVPIVNRAFDNRTSTRDEETLLILIKPTIIIHKEYEEDLFPS